MLRLGCCTHRRWFVVLATLCLLGVGINAISNDENQAIGDNPLQLAMAHCATHCTTQYYTSLDLWLSLQEVSEKSSLPVAFWSGTRCVILVYR